MRTTIILNDDLMREAFKCAENIHTKRELIEVALKEFIARRKPENLQELKGKIQFDDSYDYKVTRTGQ